MQMSATKLFLLFISQCIEKNHAWKVKQNNQVVKNSTSNTHSAQHHTNLFQIYVVHWETKEHVINIFLIYKFIHVYSWFPLEALWALQLRGPVPSN